MRTLNETLTRMETQGGVGQSLRKHLSAVGVHDWEDITRGKLYDLKDHLAETLAPNSQRTVMANIKALFNRYKDELELPSDYDKILVAKAVKPLKTYLAEEDLAKLEAYTPPTNKQKYIQNVFIICAFTGLRVSDALKLTMENVVGDSLHYVSKKTKKVGAIPLKKGLAERIKWVSEHPEFRVTESGYNKQLKVMCRRAGITDEVMVYTRGVEKRGPKWKFVTSHTARISTATCLDKRGVRIGDISQLLQHSSIQMTERYIIRDHVELSEKALQFFA